MKHKSGLPNMINNGFETQIIFLSKKKLKYSHALHVQYTLGRNYFKKEYNIQKEGSITKELFSKNIIFK